MNDIRLLAHTNHEFIVSILKLYDENFEQNWNIILKNIIVKTGQHNAH